jgi:uncharacterized protein
MTDQSYRVHLLYDQRIPMRDGVTLSGDVYLPVAEGPFPTILHRTPYESSAERWIDWAVGWARQGYAVVCQDCRGKYESGGIFYAYSNEAADGVDTVEWIGNQSWCNGKIGTWGRSYGALVQWLMAPEASSLLTCMAPHVISDDYFADVAYIGGALQLAHGILAAILYETSVSQLQGPASAYLFNSPEFYRHLPLIEMDVVAIGRPIEYWRDWLTHATFDDYWKSISWTHLLDKVDLPVFQQSGWYDPYAEAILRQGMALSKEASSSRARAGQKMMIGPWAHSIPTTSRLGEVDFGPEAYVSIRDLETRWFDHWLKGIDTGILDGPPISLFVMGENVWRGENEWPLSRAVSTDFYLHSKGKANSLFGDGSLSTDAPTSEPPDHFDYDPMRPVWTVGGNNSLDSLTPKAVDPIVSGPMDQRSVERRDDVLVYTTAVLEEDLEVTGPIEVVLYAATSAMDTDFTARLCDVYPDGYSMNLAEGIIRARHRHGRESNELVTPGQEVEYRIRLNPTSVLFKRGHRIRLDISSSNFPRFSRNPNTGEDIATGTRVEIAHQTILHSSSYPSRIVLPVIPR